MNREDRACSECGRAFPREGPRPQISKTRRIAAWKHLSYERFMLAMTGNALAAGFFPDGPVHDALLESFIVHTRNLLHFLDPIGAKPSDVIAVDFLDDPTQWEGERGGLPAVLSGIRRRANKEVAHLTYNRVDVGENERDWDVPGIARALAQRFDRFSQLVDPDFVEEAEAAMAEAVAE